MPLEGHPSFRIHIDGSWSALEMANELAAIDYLYTAEILINPALEPRDFGIIFARAPFAISDRKSPYRQLVLEYLIYERFHPMLLLAARERCGIQKIKFESPGFQDIAGIARALEVVGGGIRYILEWNQQNERHKADMAEKQLARQQMAIDNAAKFLDVMQQAKYPPKKITEAMETFVRHQRTLVDLVEAGKITKVDIPD